MVHPDRKREREKHDEGEPAHGVAIEASSRCLRHQRVEGDVGRHQPEIDDGVQRHRKQGPTQSGIDLCGQAERARQQDSQQLDDDAACRPRPQQRRGGDREHGKRHRLTRIVALPYRHVVDHQHDPDHRAADQQEGAYIVPDARQQRRVERVEHACTTGKHGEHRHQSTDQADEEANPGSGDATQRTAEAGRNDRVTKPHREECGDHISHRGAMQRDGRVVCVWIVKRGRQRAAHQHLPRAQRDRGQKDGKGNPAMVECKTAAIVHSLSSRWRRAAGTVPLVRP